jgi:outer membrane protein assembly factor BamA
MDQLRNLYATEGYINCVAIPTLRINESHRTIDLVFEIDEGKPFDFGRLLLNGTEPHAGASQALMESWKTLQGKRVNPYQLKSWLTANASEWPGSRDFDRIVTYMQQPDSHVADIRLSFYK